MKITVTLDLDENEWARLRGLRVGSTPTMTRHAVRDDMAVWLRDALRAAPVPVGTFWKSTHRNTPGTVLHRP